METVYRLGKGWKYFCLILSPLLIMAGIFGIVSPFLGLFDNSLSSFAVTCIGAIFVFTGIISILYASSYKIIFTNSAVISYTLFQKHIISYEEINGYQISTFGIIIVPANRSANE